MKIEKRIGKNKTEGIKFKGISPIIASVLLIAFTVAVAGIVISWGSNFFTTSTKDIGTAADKEITCSRGSVNIRNLKFSNPRLSGIIENNGQIALGNFTLSIVYQNATSENIELCAPASGAVNCTTSNLSLAVSHQATFNITIAGTNYQEIRATTNCSSVVDTAKRSDVS